MGMMKSFTLFLKFSSQNSSPGIWQVISLALPSAYYDDFLIFLFWTLSRLFLGFNCLISKYVIHSIMWFLNFFGLSLVSLTVGLSGIETTDREWFFFSSPELKHPNGKQFNRSTDAGFWKVSGYDREIRSGASLIGKKTYLVFYKRGTAASKWEKTNWKRHEYRTTLKELDGTKPGQVGFLSYLVFCYLVCLIGGLDISS
jgi:hypothetical protein